jgi:hypothetical protein
MDTDMQHDMDMVKLNGYAAWTWTFSMDMQNWTWSCCMNMQYEHGYKPLIEPGNGHALGHGHAEGTWTRICSLDMDMQHGHGHAAWT